MPWTPPRPTAALSAVALAACGLLLAGCSSGAGAARTAAGGSASASASASPSSDAKAMDAYRQCLARHGVTMAPRPTGSRGPGGGGWDGASGGPGRRASADPQRSAASQACADLRPQSGGRGGGPGGGDGSALKAFSSCLKDHGVVLPSASPGAPGTRGFPTSDPQSAQAFETCRALLPQRGQNAPKPGASPSASAL
ncbi:hypothetical protein [Streptomyces sp. NPDC001903]|uniref:hypothetical protein n=1 Tax=Streptomyces sp. NPDC001903 TaxID=3364622 RepID=UPI0036974262